MNKSNKPLLIVLSFFFFCDLVFGWLAFFDTDKISPESLVPIRIFVIILLFILGSIFFAIMIGKEKMQLSEIELQINLFKEGKITDERLLIQKPKEGQEIENKSLPIKILRYFFGYGWLFLVFAAFIGGAIFGTISIVQNWNSFEKSEKIFLIILITIFDSGVISGFIFPLFKKSPRDLTEIEFIPNGINIILEKNLDSHMISLDELKEIKIEIKGYDPDPKRITGFNSELIILLKTLTSKYALKIEFYKNFQSAVEFKNKIYEFCSQHYPTYLNQKKTIYEKSGGTLIIFFE